MSAAHLEASRAAAQEFARALDAHDEWNVAPQESPPSWSVARQAWRRALEKPLVLSLLTALVAFAILAILRPPFVMHFDYDRDRPWRGAQRISWLSVFVVCSVAAGAPFAAWKFCA